VWDLGANTGEYSRAARDVASLVIAFDMDPAAVERNYRRMRADSETGIRGPADAVLALALIHHLAIGNNLPLERVAGYLARLGRVLIIEFVPKSDPQVARLLISRPDIFPTYTKEGFEGAFSRYFSIERATRIEDSERWLYCMTATRLPPA
jgi:ribosomal protein L11 methylase PrmA